MNLEALELRLRPRDHWESMDLGVAMVQRWWRPLFAAWLALLLPLTLLLNLVLIEHLWLVGLLLWWLKPLLDRIPLHILARAAFGEIPTVASTLRALPQLLFRRLFAALLWERLDPGRSAFLPVDQLEGFRGRERSRRRLLLGRQSPGAGGWLTVICFHLEMAIDLALFALLWLALPEFMANNLAEQLMEHEQLAAFAVNGVVMIGIAVMEPFYVAAGFALYLNRRTRLEAWDLEIGLRRLVERLQTGGERAVTAGGEA